MWHFVFELLGYSVGAQIYWRYARTMPQPKTVDRFFLLGCALFGAFLGSKLLHIFEHLPYMLTQHDLVLWISGKSVLGGFIGGTLAVEVGKKLIGWNHSTGDAWVLPIAVGLMIGRIGCQLSGLNDLTYGIVTTLPWGWDYGDGLSRHPTAFYEIILVALLTLAINGGKPTVSGGAFAQLMLGYCLIRLGLECLKPPYGGEVGFIPVARYFGLTGIQWAALFGIGYFSLHMKNLKKLYRNTNNG